MADKEKSKTTGASRKPDNLSDFINKIVVCETLSGETLTGVLTEHSTYEFILVETKEMKSKTPKKTLVFKHGVVSIREME